LRLCRRCLGLFALGIALRRANFALRDRLLRDFLAFIVLVDAEANPAGDSQAALAISSEPVIADQRTNARRLTFDRIKGIDVCDLHIEPHASMFVEQIEGALRRCVPVAVHGTRIAANPTQLGLQRAWKIDRRRLIGFTGRWR
jgi:hypothetical protein